LRFAQTAPIVRRRYARDLRAAGFHRAAGRPGAAAAAEFKPLPRRIRTEQPVPGPDRAGAPGPGRQARQASAGRGPHASRATGGNALGAETQAGIQRGRRNLPELRWHGHSNPAPFAARSSRDGSRPCGYGVFATECTGSVLASTLRVRDRVKRRRRGVWGRRSGLGCEWIGIRPASKTRRSSRESWSTWPARISPACGRKVGRLPGQSACFSEPKKIDFRPRSARGAAQRRSCPLSTMAGE